MKYAIPVFLLLFSLFVALAYGAGSLEPIDRTSAIVQGCSVSDPTIADSVWIYDGQKGSGGKLLTITRAGIPGSGTNCPDNHRFTFTLADSYKDGRPHTIYAYRGGVELLPVPQTYNSAGSTLPPGVIAEIPVQQGQTLCIHTYLRPTDAVGSYWADVPPCASMVNNPIYVLTYPNGTTPCAQPVMGGVLFDLWTTTSLPCQHP